MTSYVMCNKKKLGIKKSDIECLKKSVEDRKLEYFKSGEEVSKAFIVQELYKSMTDPLYMAKSREKLVQKQVIATNGKTYKTTGWANKAVKKSFASIVNELKKSYFDNIGA